jgi:hypothetical protein
MTFWSKSALAPKRNFRWQLRITGFGDSDVVWWAKTVNVPSFDVSEVAHDYFDNKYYYPGRLTWSDLEATLVDPISPDAVDLTLDIINKAGYNVTNSPGAKKTMSKKASSADGLKDVIIDLVDTEGRMVESWTLKNAFIKAAKFGDLDYSNDELRTISLTFKYDWAVCTIKAENGAETEYFEDVNPPGPTS